MRKSKIKRIVLTVIISVLMLTSLSGCSVLSLFNSFDASKYVLGMMDAYYKGIFENYLEQTEDTEENAQKVYDDVMAAKAEVFAAYAGVELNEESKPVFEEFVRKIYSQVKYEVKEAVKTKENFTVDIVISPMLILESIEEQYNKYVEDFNARNDAYEFSDWTDEEYDKEYERGILEIFKNSGDNIQYGEDVTITVNVVLEGETYNVSEADIMKIDEKVLKID